MSCSHTSTCQLFPLILSNSVLAAWKRMYCDVPEHVTCARYQASCDMKPVPKTLLPNGRHIVALPTKGR